MYKTTPKINNEDIWSGLSHNNNPNAIHILEKYPEKIHWDYLSSNPNAIYLLEKNIDKVSWECLVSWGCLAMNPNALHLIFDYDYEGMREQHKELFKELIEYVFHPTRLIRICKQQNIEVYNYLDIL